MKMSVITQHYPTFLWRTWLKNVLGQEEIRDINIRIRHYRLLSTRKSKAPNY